MALKGSKAKQINSLLDAVRANREDLIPRFLAKEGEVTKEEGGLQAIHLSAQTANKRIFEYLAKSGINAFSLNSAGFSPFYFAKQSTHFKSEKDKNEFLSFIDSFSPLNLPDRMVFLTQASPSKAVTQLLTLDQHLNEMLQCCGFHSFISINTPPLGNDPFDKIAFFLNQILKNAKNTATGIFHVQFHTKFNAITLSSLVSGVLEEITAVQFFSLINDKYIKADLSGQLVCIYLVKELILLDADNEWIMDPDFQSQFDQFLQKTRACSALEAQGFSDSLNQFFQLKRSVTLKHEPSLTTIDTPFTFPAEEGQVSVFLGEDLLKIFADALLQLTPMHFRATSLFKKEEEEKEKEEEEKEEKEKKERKERKEKKEKNDPWQKLSRLTNEVSRMVCLDILKAKEIKSIFKFYLDVIDACLSEEKTSALNLSAAFAIYNGLHFPTITRLELNRELSPRRQGRLQHFKGVFSFERGFDPLRQLGLKNPNSLPVTAILAGDKEEAQQKSIEIRLLANGKINRQLFDHRLFLASLPVMPYKTELLKKLETLDYSVQVAEALSHAIKPPTEQETAEALSQHAIKLSTRPEGSLISEDSSSEGMLQFEEDGALAISPRSPRITKITVPKTPRRHSVSGGESKPISQSSPPAPTRGSPPEPSATTSPSTSAPPAYTPLRNIGRERRRVSFSATTETVPAEKKSTGPKKEKK
ncbi:MAG: RasGEF domain-containing protein [Candidatus Berkiellales bacterium]